MCKFKYLIAAIVAFSSCSFANTVIIHGEQDGALTKEAARQSGENWDNQKALRKKINQRAAKEFDKFDKAIDDKLACNTSENVNAY